MFAAPWHEMHVAIDGYSAEFAERTPSIQTDAGQSITSEVISPIKMAERQGLATEKGWNE